MSKLDNLMQREMTRKQFLMTMFGALISLFGISSVMGALTPDSSDHKPADYGMRNYGP